MKTPWISFQPQPQKLEYHAPSGQKRSLTVCEDGQLESALRDRLEPGFVADLADPRLHTERPGAGSLGPGWTYTYQGGEKLRLGSPDGPHQLVTFEPLPEGGHRIEVTTFNQGVEHHLAGDCREGQVQAASERAQLEVSAAGVDVLCDGKVLFQMPSAYTGGCTW
jgi:hypothetical protein